MTNPSKPSRERLVAGAADMISRRGLNATSIRELAKYSKTPLGSTYHYFPGGKHQLVSEAVQFVGDKVSESLQASLNAGPIEGVKAFLTLWRDIVISSHYRAGCPVLSVAVEEPSTDEEVELLGIAADIFRTWRTLLTDSLRAQGVSRAKAEPIATLVIASVEGSIALCRAERSVAPLEQVSSQILMILKSVLPQTK